MGPFFRDAIGNGNLDQQAGRRPIWRVFCDDLDIRPGSSQLSFELYRFKANYLTRPKDPGIPTGLINQQWGQCELARLLEHFLSLDVE